MYVQFTANYFLLYDYQLHCVVVVVFRVDRAALLKWGLNSCVVQFSNQFKAAISVSCLLYRILSSAEEYYNRNWISSSV